MFSYTLDVGGKRGCTDRGLRTAGTKKHTPPTHYKHWAYTSSPAFFLIHGDGFTGLYTGGGGCI